MKKLLILTGIVILIGAPSGCRCGSKCPCNSANNTNSTTTSYPLISEPMVLGNGSVASSNSCGPGCKSCAGNTVPSLSGPQAFGSFAGQ
jgi:hypothetical protein